MNIYIIEYEDYTPYQSRYALINEDAELLTPFIYEWLIPVEDQKFSGKISNEYFVLNDEGAVIERGLSEAPPHRSFAQLENDGEKIKEALKNKNTNDSIERIQEEDSFSGIFGSVCSNDASQYFWVKKNGKYGYLNRQLEEVIAFKYDEANAFYFGRAFVRTKEVWSMIDRQGNEITSLPIGVSPPEYRYKKEVGTFYASGCYPITKGEKQKGLINRHGEIIIPCEYLFIGSIKEGYLALVKGDRENQEVYIANLRGEVHSQKYDSVSIEKYNGEIFFRVGLQDNFGILDANFQTVIPIEYDRLRYINELGMMVAFNGEKYGVINIKNEIELPFKYERFADDRYGLTHQYFAHFSLDDSTSGYVNLSTKKEFTSPSMFRAIGGGGWSSHGISGGISVEFGKIGYGAIQIDKDEIWYARDKDYNYHLIPDEKLHGPALLKLEQAVATNPKLAAKDIRKIFKSVHYWHNIWFDTITPLIDEKNLFIVETLLEMAAKKAYGKDILAGGTLFFEMGLALIQKHASESYATFSNTLLELAKKEDKKRLILQAIEKIASNAQLNMLTTSSKKIEENKIKISNIQTIWNLEKDAVFSSYPKFESELFEIDRIFCGNLREQVRDATTKAPDGKKKYIAQLKKNEKCLEKIAKSLKTDTIKEIRDVFIVFRAWVEKHSIFEEKWLNTPVTEAALQSLQDKILTPLPLCFLESYRICNGINDSGNEETCYMNDGDLLFSSVEEITRECDSIREYATNFVSDEKRKEKYDEEVKCWIPVFNSNGNACILNLGNTLPSDYSRSITRGAIFNYNHEDGNLDELTVRYSSFKRLIEDLSWAHEL